MWNKVNPADEDNMCSWAMRCLLIEHGNYKILIDTGMGTKQDDKFFSYYHPHGEDTLEKSLAKHGFTPDDITDVFLTHLHFDHCGGAIKRDGDKLVPAFPKAIYKMSAPMAKKPISAMIELRIEPVSSSINPNENMPITIAIFSLTS